MTTLSQRLASLHAERAEALAAYERALDGSLTENRDITDAEQLVLDESKQNIERLDKQIDIHNDAERLKATRATPVLNAVPGDRPGTFVTLPEVRERPLIQMKRRDTYKGADFTRMAIAVSLAGQWNAAEYARQRWADDELGEVIHRALWLQRVPTPPMNSTNPPGTESGGGSLVRTDHLGQEFIDLLRPLLIADRMPSMRKLQFNSAGTLNIPRQNAGVAGGYIGEAQSITVERLIFGQIQLRPSKLAVIVPTTVELLQRSDPGVEQLIRDDMLAGTARTIDRFFFSQAAAANNPAGILQGITRNTAGDITVAAGLPVPPAPGAVNFVTEALRAMIMALRMANAPMTAPVWVMHARTKEYLRLLRTTQEIFAFKAEIDAGTLLGYPIIDSTNIPIPWAGPPVAGAGITAYALIDAAQLIWADDMAPSIDASEHATIQSRTDPVQPPAAPTTDIYSAFQNDMVFMRIRMRHTWARRYDVTLTWAYTEE